MLLQLRPLNKTTQLLSLVGLACVLLWTDACKSNHIYLLSSVGLAYGVTVEEATTSGASLQELLIELMQDVSEVRSLGGRLVARHLEFDAGIVMEELARAGLSHLQQSWRDFAQGGRLHNGPGCCSLDPGHALGEASALEERPQAGSDVLETVA